MAATGQHRLDSAQRRTEEGETKQGRASAAANDGGSERQRFVDGRDGRRSPSERRRDHRARQYRLGRVEGLQHGRERCEAGIALSLHLAAPSASPGVRRSKTSSNSSIPRALVTGAPTSSNHALPPRTLSRSTRETDRLLAPSIPRSAHVDALDAFAAPPWPARTCVCSAMPRLVLCIIWHSLRRRRCELGSFDGLASSRH